MAEEQGPRSAPAWQVLRLEDTTSYVAGKGAVRVRRVYYQLFDGSESYVELPAAGYTADKAARLIDEHAQELAKTLQLKGEQITFGGM